MAISIYKRKSKITGAVSFAAQVRVRPQHARKGTPYSAIESATFRVIDADLKSARSVAKAWAKQRAHELATAAPVSKDVKMMTVGKLINAYLEAPETKELKTINDIERLVGWWLTEHNTTKLLDFDDDAMRAARDKLKREKSDPATTNRYVSAMRRCWNWGIVTKKVPSNQPWARELMLKEPTARKRILSDAEREKLLKVSASDALMHTAIVVSLATGMRQDNLLQLEWRHIDLERGAITLFDTKNGTSITVHAPSSAVAALTAFRKSNVTGLKRVFLNSVGTPLTSKQLTNRFDKILERAGIPTAGDNDFNWHDLRRTCASILGQNGASLLEIGSVLGHKSPQATMCYAHFVKGAKVTGHDKLDKLLSGTRSYAPGGGAGAATRWRSRTGAPGTPP